MTQWLLSAFNNSDLQRQAFQETLNEHIINTLVQDVVNDVLKSFKAVKIEESNPLELKAKEILIRMTKTKYMAEDDKQLLLQFLIAREVEGYEINYSCLFNEKWIA